MKQFLLKIHKAIYSSLDLIIVVGEMCIVALILAIMAPKGSKDPEIDRIVQSLDYFKDKKSNLCFVGHQNKDRDYVVGYVPCTPEVENLISERARLAKTK